MDGRGVSSGAEDFSFSSVILSFLLLFSLSSTSSLGYKTKEDSSFLFDLFGPLGVWVDSVWLPKKEIEFTNLIFHELDYKKINRKFSFVSQFLYTFRVIV